MCECEKFCSNERERHKQVVNVVQGCNDDDYFYGAHYNHLPHRYCRFSLGGAGGRSEKYFFDDIGRSEMMKVVAK